MSKYRFIIPIIGISIGASLYYAFTLLQEKHPIEVFERQVSTFNAHAGDDITITSDVVRTKPGCASTIRRVWYDASGNEFHETDVDRQPLGAGKENFFATLQIPPKAAEGTLRLDTSVEFYCNRVQKLLKHGSILDLPDIFFRIDKSK